MRSDRILMKLPLRFVPGRKLQAFTLLIYVFGAGMLVWSMLFEFSRRNDPVLHLSPMNELLSWIFMLAFFFGVLGGLAAAILRLMPGSPLFHLALAPDAITIRRLLKAERFSWAELGAFRRVTLPDDNEVTCIVAMAPGREAADDKDRYRRAVFRLRSDPYTSRAEDLAEWLNMIRKTMTERTGAAPEIEVPPVFVRQVIGTPNAAAAMAAGAGRRSRVVER
ncbi:MAG TPA: hypothetical protein VHE77_03235 [Dongiaceae bacterium]|jgi:hypothetical protein|nr:hypothetical protein [Dongiaceae bacterium]